jgi:hypothetical protein
MFQGVFTLMTFFFEQGGSTKHHGVTYQAALISVQII